jgi:hypothetical protein
MSDYLLDLIAKEEDSIRVHKNQYYLEFKRLGMKHCGSRILPITWEWILA